MKKILIGVVVVLVIVGGGVAYVFLNAGDIVKQIVEEVGSDATKATVTLDKVDLSIQSGEAALNGFNMGNPQGFKSPKAMSFGIVSVKTPQLRPLVTSSPVTTSHHLSSLSPHISHAPPHTVALA